MPGRRHRGRRAAGAAVIVAALIGCGGGGPGDSSPRSAGDRRAALDRWAQRADAACLKSNRAVAKRGWPASLVDLDRLTVRALPDVRAASAAIRRIPPPAGSEKRIAPFVESLERLDPLMDRLGSTTETLDPDKLTALIPELQAGLLDVEDAAEDLGLRECAAHEEHTWVPDAIRAPVFAQKMADLDRRVVRRVKAVTEPAATAREAARNLDALSEVVELMDRGLSRLKPPSWAQAEAGAYVDTLRDLASALDSAASELSDPTLTPAEVMTAQRGIDRAFRVERKLYKRLYREMGAVPVLPSGGGGDEADPDGEEASEA